MGNLGSASEDKRGRLTAWLVFHRAGLLVALLTILALVLRLHDLGLRGLAHPEIYIPGIDLPPLISEPPPRHTLAETLAFHIHEEAHPVGWYLAMFGWASVFGTTEWWLRFPAVLFGAASVPLIYRLASEAYGRVAGLCAAALLTAHGLHIFWSQSARMYVPGMFFSILSTWLLLRIVYGTKRSRWSEIGYVVATVAGIQTTDLFSPLLLLQVGWTILAVPAEKTFSKAGLVELRFTGAAYIVQLQAIVLMLSSPNFQHSIYLARGDVAEYPNLKFLMDYLSFGFMYARDWNSSDQPPIALIAAIPICILAILLLVSGLVVPAREQKLAPSDHCLPRWLPFTIAIAMTSLMIWLALIAHKRTEALFAISIGPLLCLALPSASLLLTETLARRFHGFQHWFHMQGPKLLFVIIALLGPLTLFLLSFGTAMLVPRAFLVFIPQLLVLIAAGMTLPIVRRRLRGVLVGLCLLLGIASLPYSYANPGSPRGYKQLAAKLKPRLLKEDRVLVRYRNWASTPFFYYLRNVHFVDADFLGSHANLPTNQRVWYISWPDPDDDATFRNQRPNVLANYHIVEHVDAFHARAELFVHNQN